MLLPSCARLKQYGMSFKKLSSRNQNHTLEVIEKLANGQTLEIKHKDHLLVGNFKDCRECRIRKKGLFCVLYLRSLLFYQRFIFYLKDGFVPQLIFLF